MSKKDEENQYSVSAKFYDVDLMGRGEFENPPGSPVGIEDVDSVKVSHQKVHLNSIIYFINESEKIENWVEGTSEGSDSQDSSDEVDIFRTVPIGNRYDIMVVQIITSCISLLESTINEFYVDNLEAKRSDVENAREGERIYNDDSFLNILDSADKVRRDFQYINLLKKYQLVLTYAQKDTFDTGREPYQSVNAIKKMRNNLVHSKVEWKYVGGDNVEILPGHMRNKFDANPFSNEIADYRSHLSADCARWCANQTIEFIHKFYDKIGIDAPDIIPDNDEDILDIDLTMEVDLLMEDVPETHAKGVVRDSETWMHPADNRVLKLLSDLGNLNPGAIEEITTFRNSYIEDRLETLCENNYISNLCADLYAIESAGEEYIDPVDECAF